VIDFGDLTDSWAVSELAIAASSVLGHPGCEPISILPAVRAFHHIRPLTAAEVEALWPLLVLRTAVLIVSGAQQATLDPDNQYLVDQSGGEWRMFDQATSVQIDVMTEAIKADLGLAVASASVAGALVEVDPASVVTLDLSTTSDVYDFAFDDDGTLKTGVENELATAAVQNGAQLVVTQYGQARLSRTRKLSQQSPDPLLSGSHRPTGKGRLRPPLFYARARTRSSRRSMAAWLSGSSRLGAWPTLGTVTSSASLRPATIAVAVDSLSKSLSSPRRIVTGRPSSAR
jgi:hypothetical protein